MECCSSLTQRLCCHKSTGPTHFHLRLPGRMRPAKSPRCADNSSYCNTLNDIISVIHTIHVQTESKVNEVVKSIKSLIPQTELAHRGYRSFLPFIGSLSKTLFGTATMDDVNLLATHINALNSRTRQLATAMQHTEN